MTSLLAKYLDNYVKVVIKKGLNLQEGQCLLITNPFSSGVHIELAPFVEKLTEEAYINGAKFVDVLWRDDKIQEFRFNHAPSESFEQYPIWRAKAIEELFENGDALLFIYDENPDLFKNANPESIAVSQKTMLKNMESALAKIVKNFSNWIMIAAPITGWADKLFPEVSQSERINKFWDVLFEICRVRNDDPIQSWKDHVDHLDKRAQYLNDKQYQKLKLSAPGTNLEVGLPHGHIWQSGSEISRNGIRFIANIPTEEVFTLPDKNKVDGFVSSTKSLYFNGRLAEDFKLTLKEGKIIDISAKKGEDFLSSLIEQDEGASRLGEIALVPHSSPISQSNKLFYNMLIDENAANHLALGFAYRSSLKNGNTLSDEEFSEAGGNVSGIHIDFMIGSSEMNVDGILKEGT
ncbi:MAG: aminopeptidase, partial [Candidatus Lokiarchaeota archaeon]